MARVAGKYDVDAENEAACWIETITGTQVVGNFCAALHTGEVLCELLNKIKPGILRKINSAGKPFKERENISNFLKACRILGVREHMLFSTDDLYDEKNVSSVVNCIHAFGGAVQRNAPDFHGPYIGVADTSHVKQCHKHDCGHITQTGGFSVAMERTEIVSQDTGIVAIMPTCESKKEDTNEDVDANLACDMSPGSPQAMQSTATSSPSNPTVPNTAPMEASMDEADINKDNLPTYGLDSFEDGAAKWIEALTGAHVAGNFSQTLHTGQVLCELVNKIKPATITKINSARMPFKERENISNFIKACRALGVQEHALFSTDDLYDEKNLPSVINCIHALGGAVQRTVPEFNGPHFGIPDKSNAKRDLKRDLGPAQQTGGLNSAMERTKADTSKNIRIICSIDGAISRDGGSSKLGVERAKVIERACVVKNSPLGG